MSMPRPDLIEWKKEWQVGFDRFDGDHAELMRLANAVILTLHEGNAPETSAPVLDSLVGHATRHFDSEEALMKETRFDSLHEHAAAHDRLVRELVRFTWECKQGKISAADAGKFLLSWLLDHVLAVDVYYVPHFHKLGLH